ncbi:SDR family oxidoreductase [Aureimonas altamirensis]|uniref:SDR family NAD(P)-dependent oxidoreductase n=1 Tax=Aureimonas altamirensis TaxID=370622 RepID=UPI001E5FFBB0|nr:SDR family NAD(P)-dependent oxidoreductase [Aureimonas altamirensis]UHD45960.1 SDR family oxidoreductase [Aureimonas altamirensis]
MTTALVTGAAGGIGRAIALRLAADGVAIAAVDIDTAATDETVRAVRALGGRAHVIRADVSRSDDWSAALDTAEAELGPVDMLVNNAGIEGAFAPIDSYPEDEFDRVLAVNIRGVFLGLRHGLKRMRSRGSGSIVNIASTSSIRGRAGLAGYVAAKHAVLGLTRSAALDMSGTTIRVNALLPGPVDTRMIHAIDARAYEAGGSIQRAGHNQPIPPESVAETVAFLLSDKAAHVNGAGWVIDAGSTVP